MELLKYDEKHVCVTDIYGETHTGIADYYDSGYCLHEYGEDEEGIWTFDGQSMKITSEFFEATLIFEENGTMIMQEDREGSGNSEDFLNTVLIKK